MSWWKNPLKPDNLFAEHSFVWNTKWSFRHFGFGFENTDLGYGNLCSVGTQWQEKIG